MKTNTVANLMRILAMPKSPTNPARMQPFEQEAAHARQRLLDAAVDAAKVSIFTHLCEAMNDMPGIVRTQPVCKCGAPEGGSVRHYTDCPVYTNRYGIED